MWNMLRHRSRKVVKQSKTLQNHFPMWLATQVHEVSVFQIQVSHSDLYTMSSNVKLQAKFKTTIFSLWRGKVGGGGGGQIMGIPFKYLFFTGGQIDDETDGHREKWFVKSNSSETSNVKVHT